MTARRATSIVTITEGAIPSRIQRILQLLAAITGRRIQEMEVRRRRRTPLDQARSGCHARVADEVVVTIIDRVQLICSRHDEDFLRAGNFAVVGKMAGDIGTAVETATTLGLDVEGCKRTGGSTGLHGDSSRSGYGRGVGGGWGGYEGRGIAVGVGLGYDCGVGVVGGGAGGSCEEDSLGGCCCGGRVDVGGSINWESHLRAGGGHGGSWIRGEISWGGVGVRLACLDTVCPG